MEMELFGHIIQFSLVSAVMIIGVLTWKDR